MTPAKNRDVTENPQKVFWGFLCTITHSIYHMNFSSAWIDISLIGVMILSLIALLEPITTLSFYAKLHPDATSRDFRRDGQRIALVIAIAMIVTFFLGKYLLLFFGLKTEYFKMAGAIVLFFIAFSMVRGEETDDTKITKVEWDHLIHEYLNKWLIIPLAFPLTFSAPGMAYVIAMHTHGTLNWIIAIIAASIITGIVVMFGGRFIKKIGEAGTHLIIRILGLFLMSVALQNFGETLIEIIQKQ
jgi:multiple antibiotic resistance protein